MDTIFRDLRYSLRLLLKSPAFTAVAIISIALGIGANTTVFSVINAVLLKSLPYKDPASLILVWGNDKQEARLKNRNQVSATDVADFRSQSTAFEEVAAYTGWFPLDVWDFRGRESSGNASRRRFFQSDERHAAAGARVYA